MKLGSDPAESRKYRRARASSARPTMTAGTINAGRLVTAGPPNQVGEEAREGDGAGDGAVRRTGRAVALVVVMDVPSQQSRRDRAVSGSFLALRSRVSAWTRSLSWTCAGRCR